MDFIVEVVILMIVTYLLLHSYALKSTKGHVIVLTYISWLLSFGIVIILPCDIYYSQQSQHLLHLSSIPSSVQATLSQLNSVNNIVGWFWLAQYWTTFLLSWLVLPLIQEYEDSGEITLRLKLRRALINNVVFYLGSLLIVLLTYLLFSLRNDNALSLQSLLAYVSTISNCVGNLLIAVLMSQGLITIPKTLYQSRNMASRLKYIQLRISQVTKQEQEQYLCVMQGIQRLYLTSKGQTEKTKKVVEKVVLLIPEQYYREAIQSLTQQQVLNSYKQDMSQQSQQQDQCQQQNNEDNGEVSEEEQSIYDLNRIIKRAIQGYTRLQIEQQMYICEGTQLVSILTQQQKNSFLNYVSPIYIYRVQITNLLKWIASVFLAILGIVIVLAEFIISFQMYYYGQSSGHHENNQINRLFTYLLETRQFNAIQFISFAILSYLCVVVNQGLFKLKLANLYALYKNQQTDAPSLLFASINFSRVSVPLCFNFLRLTQIKNSQFQIMMGQMDQGFFTNDSSLLFSSILVALCIFNLFNVYTKILNYFGLEYYEFNNIFTTNNNNSNIEIGKKILENERSKNEKNNKLFSYINKIFNKNSKQNKGTVEYSSIAQSDDIS